MKKLLGLSAIVLVGLSFSSLSYGFGMSCSTTDVPTTAAVEAGTPFMFTCTNTGPVAYGSFNLISTENSTTVDSITCPDDSHIAVGDRCTIDANFLASSPGSYTINFNAVYGGDTFLNIFGASGVAVTASGSGYNFTSSNAPAGGTGAVITASDGSLYAVSRGQLYKYNGSAWVLIPMPATTDEGSTNNAYINSLISNGDGYLYVRVNADSLTVWKYNIATEIWTNTQFASQVTSLAKTATPLKTENSTSTDTMIADSDGKVVLTDGSDIWKYDGATWTDTAISSQVPGGRVESIVADSTDKVYAVMSVDHTNCSVWKYTGSAWVSTDISVSVPNLDFVYDIAADSAGNVYVQTETGVSPFVESIWKYNGTVWTDTAASTAGLENIRQIVVATDNLVYARTAGGNVANSHVADDNIWKYNGTTWTDTGANDISAGITIRTMVTDSNAHIYAQTTSAAGINDVWKYTGSAWVDTGADAVLAAQLAGDVGELRAGDHGELYLGTGLDVSKYPGTGTDWTEINTGLPSWAFAPAVTAPGTDYLFAITSLGIMSYNGSGSWLVSLPSSTQRFMMNLYAGGDNMVYARVALDPSDTTEDLLQYNVADPEWVSTGFSSDVEGGHLEILGSVTLNNISYVETYNREDGVKDIWTYEPSSGRNTSPWSDTSFPTDVDLRDLDFDNTVIDEAGNFYVIDGRGRNLYQYKNHAWNSVYTAPTGADLEKLYSNPTNKDKMYLVGVDNQHYFIAQYNSNTGSATVIPVPSEVVLPYREYCYAAVDNIGNLYILVAKETSDFKLGDVNVYASDVYEYKPATSSWVDTGLDVISKDADVYALSADHDGVVYASTLGGTYLYHGGSWTKIDTHPSDSILQFAQHIAYGFFLDGIFQSAIPGVL